MSEQTITREPAETAPAVGIDLRNRLLALNPAERADLVNGVPPMESAGLYAVGAVTGRPMHVFPLRSDDKRPHASLGAKGGLEHGTTDLQKILHWMSTCPDANLGVWLKPSRLAVLDIEGDGKAGSSTVADRLNAVSDAFGAVPQTATVATRSGGLHFYFTVPEGGECPPVGLGRLANPTTGEVIDGVEIRGYRLDNSGNYAVLPSSGVETGNWEWLGAMEAAPLPDWMLAASKPKKKRTPWVKRSTQALAGGKRIRAAIEAIRSAPDGALNEALNRGAFIFGSCIRDGVITENEARTYLEQVAREKGHDLDGSGNASRAAEGSMFRTIESGLEAGKTRSQ